MASTGDSDVTMKMQMDKDLITPVKKKKLGSETNDGSVVRLISTPSSSSSLKKTQSKNGGKYTLIGLSNTPIKYVQFHSQIRSTRTMSPFKASAMLSKREIVHGWW